MTSLAKISNLLVTFYLRSQIKTTMSTSCQNRGKHLSRVVDRLTSFPDVSSPSQCFESECEYMTEHLGHDHMWQVRVFELSVLYWTVLSDFFVSVCVNPNDTFWVVDWVILELDVGVLHWCNCDGDIDVPIPIRDTRNLQLLSKPIWRQRHLLCRFL